MVSLHFFYMTVWALEYKSQGVSLFVWTLHPASFAMKENNHCINIRQVYPWSVDISKLSNAHDHAVCVVCAQFPTACQTMFKPTRYTCYSSRLIDYDVKLPQLHAYSVQCISLYSSKKMSHNFKGLLPCHWVTQSRMVFGQSQIVPPGRISSTAHIGVTTP